MTKARTKRMENSIEIFNFFKLFDKQLKNIPFHNSSIPEAKQKQL